MKVEKMMKQKEMSDTPQQSMGETPAEEMNQTSLTEQSFTERSIILSFLKYL